MQHPSRYESLDFPHPDDITDRPVDFDEMFSSSQPRKSVESRKNFGKKKPRPTPPTVRPPVGPNTLWPPPVPPLPPARKPVISVAPKKTHATKKDVVDDREFQKDPLWYVPKKLRPVGASSKSTTTTSSSSSSSSSATPAVGDRYNSSWRTYDVSLLPKEKYPFLYDEPLYAWLLGMRQRLESPTVRKKEQGLTKQERNPHGVGAYFSEFSLEETDVEIEEAEAHLGDGGEDEIVRLQSAGHLYFTRDPYDGVERTTFNKSVTGVLEELHKPFNRGLIAWTCATSTVAKYGREVLGGLTKKELPFNAAIEHADFERWKRDINDEWMEAKKTREGKKAFRATYKWPPNVDDVIKVFNRSAHYGSRLHHAIDVYIKSFPKQPLPRPIHATPQWKAVRAFFGRKSQLDFDPRVKNVFKSELSLSFPRLFLTGQLDCIYYDSTSPDYRREDPSSCPAMVLCDWKCLGETALGPQDPSGPIDDELRKIVDEIVGGLQATLGREEKIYGKIFWYWVQLNLYKALFELMFPTKHVSKMRIVVFPRERDDEQFLVYKVPDMKEVVLYALKDRHECLTTFRELVVGVGPDEEKQMKKANELIAEMKAATERRRNGDDE